MDKTRIRLKLPSGLEVEAEGEAEFVRLQVRELLELASEKPENQAQTPAEDQGFEREKTGGLGGVVEQKGGELSLRALGAAGPSEACLILLLASELLLNLPKPTAAQLARWLRNSGLNVGRIDRILAPALQMGQVLAAGSRRSRRYELSTKGRIHAMVASEKMARQIGAASSQG